MVTRRRVPLTKVDEWKTVSDIGVQAMSPRESSSMSESHTQQRQSGPGAMPLAHSTLRLNSQASFPFRIRRPAFFTLLARRALLSMRPPFLPEVKLITGE